MKLESYHSAEDKHKWMIVRTDFFGPNGGVVEGEIIAADEESGECSMQRPDGNGGTQTVTLSFGPGGIKLVGRRR